jgi:hypothetical protein
MGGGAVPSDHLAPTIPAPLDGATHSLPHLGGASHAVPGGLAADPAGLSTGLTYHPGLDTLAADQPALHHGMLVHH